VTARIALTLVLALAAAAPARAQHNNEAATLTNVKLLPTPGRDIVTIRLMFLGGSIHDPKGKEGLTALTARLMVKGGTQLLTAAELNEQLFPMAAELEVQVDKELTVVVARVHRDHRAAFLRLLSDVITRPRFDPAEFERLRREALADIEQRLRSSDDETLGKEALEALLYAGHPYGHYVGGTVAGLKRITLADVKAHYQKIFTQDHLIIGLSGAVDPPLAQLIKIKLNGLPKQGTKPLDVPPPPPSRVRVLLVEKPAQATAISLGYPYELRRGHRDFYPMLLGVSAFGEHRQQGGRLFEALRAKRGLNYGDYAYAEAFQQDGGGTYALTNVPRRLQQFSIWIRPVEHKNALFALRAALYEATKLKQSGLTAAEVERQKGFLDAYTRLWELTDSRRLGYALDEIFYGPRNHLGAFRSAMKKMTPAEVNAVLAKYIRPEQLRIAIVTPNAQALRQALLSGQPTPITYPSPKPADILAEDKKIAAFPLKLTADEIKVVKASELFAQ
jgi:zinc protease